MLELDGSAGGGQLLRTAIALAAVTGQSVRLSGIRADRPTPGLRPQHLAAVDLLAAVTDADVSGARVDSTAIEFDPGAVSPGTYDVDIGTAGSVPLLFDAILPLAVIADGPLTVRARGGTDVRWAPTMDYLRHVKLPVLRRHGVGVAVDLDRRGFYPTGGGAATLRLWPADPGRFDVPAPDGPSTARVYSVATADLEDRAVAARQATAARTGLEAIGATVLECRASTVDATSTGSAVTVRLDRGASIVGADALGERGTPAETVGDRAGNRIRAVEASGAAVDAHLADQLLVFLAALGGELTLPSVTDHVRTNAVVLDRFGRPVTVDANAVPPRVVA